jgi:PIN domain nuclease of toxin-antitoxin system
VIKVRLGKLAIRNPLVDLIQEQVDQGLQVLPLQLEHILQVDRLPHIHKDPFDRALIAQAVVENALFVSKDSSLAAYPVKLMW